MNKISLMLYLADVCDKLQDLSMVLSLCFGFGLLLIIAQLTYLRYSLDDEEIKIWEKVKKISIIVLFCVSLFLSYYPPPAHFI